MATNADLWARREQAIPRGVGTMHQRFAVSAQNAHVTDVEGRTYVDFASGIAVTNTGHGHPRIMKAVKDQLEHFSHVCFQVTPYESYIALAEKLNALAPGDTPKKTIFFSTGAEAVENAVKIARAATGRPGVIAFKGGFHGRTFFGMALTGKVAPYKQGFGPFPGDVWHVPFPVPYLGISEEQALDALDGLFKADIEPTRVAAIIIEPVQGEGGFYQASASFMQSLRAICDAHGILLICDEIQTGFARTGKMFATEYAGIEPDLMTLAKALAGGFPLSAVTGKASVMDAAAPGGLGGTYAGSPIACAAGLAVLDIIEEEGLIARANVIGDRIKARLNALKADNKIGPAIGDVRGPGAMTAVEFVIGGDSSKPDPDLTKRVVMQGAEEGVLLLSCGVRGNVVRFLPPLTIEDDVLEEGLNRLEAAIRASVA